MQAKAALALRNESPLVLETVSLAEPGVGEVLVRLVASGLCHTDISVMDAMPLPWPAILGHEGAGIVEAVGAGVTGISPGQHVVLTTASCGACKTCASGDPSYCMNFQALNLSGGYRQDGSCTHTHAGAPVFARFLGQSSFATHLLADQSSVIPVASDLPLEIVAPFGCGIQTGAGAVFNTLGPSNGSSIAIVGAGAVGLSAVMAAAIVGCSTIIAVDKNPDRLAIAREVGATHTVDVTDGDPVEAVRGITGQGVDYAVEASGIGAVMTQAVQMLGPRGTAALVGVTHDATIAIPVTALQAGGQTIKGSLMAGGGVRPREFVAKLIDYWREGRLPVERMIRHYPFDRINDAIADAKSGVAIKPVLRISE
jgi:aryl-alcohol dehydrogenase